MGCVKRKVLNIFYDYEQQKSKTTLQAFAHNTSYFPSQFGVSNKSH